MRILIDVWGGEDSQDLLARKVLAEFALAIAPISMEIISGNLVNVRAIFDDEDFDEFDNRKTN